MKERYAYEEVEKRIVGFLERYGDENAPSAWHKLRLTLLAEAVMDGSDADAETALAFAWEVGELAFRGLGWFPVRGAVIELWDAVPPGRRALFGRVLRTAFVAAGRATSPHAPRVVPPELREARIWEPRSTPPGHPLEPAQVRWMGEAFADLDADERRRLVRRFLPPSDDEDLGPPLRLV